MRRRGDQLTLSAPRAMAVCLVMAATLGFAASASALGGPIPVLPPSISGSSQEGQVVSCSAGTWLNHPTQYAYSWQRNATTTLGTGSTYTISSADIGQVITCTVVASNTGGQASSLPSAPIIPTAAPPIGTVPLELSPPVISGTAQQGQALGCSSGAWANSPTDYAYTWQRDGSNVAGQANSQYTLTAADVNHAITCTVIAHNGAGNSAPAVSPPVIPLGPLVGLVPVTTSLPAISGSAVQGQAVTCTPGSWLNSPTSYSYAWQRDALPIAGQSVAQYTLTASDVGQAITCTVVAHNASGSSLPAVSKPIVPALASIAGGGGGAGAGGGGSAGGSGGGSGKGGGTAKPNPHAPTIKAFSVSPHTLVVRVRGKRRSTKGATFHFTLDQKAGVLIELYKRETGRVEGKRCVASTRRNAKARHCVRWVVVKVLVLKNAKAGTGQLKYAGRVGRKLIASGSYRAYAAAVAAGRWSKLRWTPLSVKTKNMAGRRARQKGKHHRT